MESGADGHTRRSMKPGFGPGLTKPSLLVAAMVVAYLTIGSVGSLASAPVDGRWEGKWTRTGGPGCDGVKEGDWVGDFTRAPAGGLRYQMWDQFFIFNAPVLTGAGITDAGVDAVHIRYVDKSTRQASTSTIVYEGDFVGGVVNGTWTLDSWLTPNERGCQLTGVWSGTQTQSTTQESDTTLDGGQPQTQPGGQTIARPGRTRLEGGGQLDVRPGGRVVLNPPMNIHIESGLMHMRERLVRFRCPAGYEPFPPETTLSTWIGARCRNVTSPHAGALVRGTEFDVEVSSNATVFRLFEGELEVTDLGRRKTVRLAPNQTTIAPAGGVPSDPAPFDPNSVERWWGEPPLAWIALLLLPGMGLYFLPLILALSLRRKLWWVVALVNLFTAWTIVGWIVALVLALVLRRGSPPSDYRGQRSPDGRWWWDGRAWRPVLVDSTLAVGIAPSGQSDPASS